MKKHLRLYYYLFRYSLMSRLEYRMDFFSRLLRSVGAVLVGFIGFTIIFQNTTFLAGWSKQEAMVLYGFFFFINELWYVLFYMNQIKFPEYIQTGELDGLLLKPVSILFLTSLRHILVYPLPNIFIALAITWYYASQIPTVTFFRYFVALLLAFNGLVILYSIMLLAVTCSFWIVRLKAFMTFYEAITEGARYPVDIFSGLARFFFTFVIPIAVIFTFPAQYLVKGLSLPLLVVSFTVGVLFFFLARSFFYFGIRYYNSASS